jgi:hypothetical protein
MISPASFRWLPHITPALKAWLDCLQFHLPGKLIAVGMLVKYFSLRYFGQEAKILGCVR